MKSIDRVRELIADQGISLFRLAQLCNVPYSTLKNAEKRNCQLSLDTIEQICRGLNIPIYEFFMTDKDWEGIEAYALKRTQNKDYDAVRVSRSINTKSAL